MVDLTRCSTVVFSEKQSFRKTSLLLLQESKTDFLSTSVRSRLPFFGGLIKCAMNHKMVSLPYLLIVQQIIRSDIKATLFNKY